MLACSWQLGHFGNSFLAGLTLIGVLRKFAVFVQFNKFLFYFLDVLLLKARLKFQFCFHFLMDSIERYVNFFA